MRRLARPTGLSRGFTQPQQQPPAHPQKQRQQRRHIRTRRPLSNSPQGLPVSWGKGPLKRTFPTFELPDIALDLDAEGSPHVRPFDVDKDSPLQESQWGYDPVVSEVKREARAMKQSMDVDLRHMELIIKLPFSGIRLSDLDAMAVALTAQPNSLESDYEFAADRRDTHASELQKDLDRNGIPKLIARDATKAIPFVLRRQQLTLAALKDPSMSGPSRGNDEQELNKGIATAKNLAQLRRLCSRIDRPETGIDFSAASVDLVHGRLLEFLRSGEEGSTPEDILRFVNNLTISRLSANKELNRSITLFGLQLASDLGLLPCILQYLQICLSMGFITSRAEDVTMTRSKTGSVLLAALRRGEGAARGTRQQIFTLITGIGPDGLAPTSCLFGLAAEDHEQKPETFKLSVRLLAELGALRLLVHHWRQRAKQVGGAMPQLLEHGTQQRRGADEADDIFVEAFLCCSQRLSSVKADEINVDITAITGDIEKDAGLDLQNINAVDAIHARRGAEKPQEPLSSFEKSYSIDDIKDAFNKPDMRTTMKRFQELMEKATEEAQGT